MSDLLPAVLWLWVFVLGLIPVTIAALFVLFDTAMDARRTKQPYWSVLRSRLQKFITGVAIFYAAVVGLIVALAGVFWIIINALGS